LIALPLRSHWYFTDARAGTFPRIALSFPPLTSAPATTGRCNPSAFAPTDRRAPNTPPSPNGSLNHSASPNSTPADADPSKAPTSPSPLGSAKELPDDAAPTPAPTSPWRAESRATPAGRIAVPTASADAAGVVLATRVATTGPLAVVEAAFSANLADRVAVATPSAAD
jgi:hypothetical protein